MTKQVGAKTTRATFEKASFVNGFKENWFAFAKPMGKIPKISRDQLVGIRYFDSNQWLPCPWKVNPEIPHVIDPLDTLLEAINRLQTMCY